MSHFTLKVPVPACRVCDCLMTLQDTRHNEPDGGTDSLMYVCENCPSKVDSTSVPIEDQRFDLHPEKIKAAAERRFKGMGNVDISSPYWIDVDYGTVRVGIGYGEPDANGVRPGSFGANYNYIKGEFE